MKKLVCALWLTLTPALAMAQAAQPAPNDTIITILQQQRENALNWHANAEARLANAIQENQKLQARIKELEEQLPKAEVKPEAKPK